MTVKADRDMIDAYYAQRKLIEPTSTQDLLWLITELAELIRAYEFTIGEAEEVIGRTSVTRTGPTIDRIFARMSDLRHVSEEYLAKMRTDWQRNSEDPNIPDLAGEISDCYMMLDRFAKSLGYDEPQVLLARKMERKGFTLDKKS